MASAPTGTTGEYQSADSNVVIRGRVEAGEQPGAYRLVIDETTVPIGYEETLPNQGGDDRIDSDCEGGFVQVVLAIDEQNFDVDCGFRRIGACCYPDGSCVDGLTQADCLAEDGTYRVLLPQTDALGASILAQRIRKALASMEEGGRGPLGRCATATFPVDGVQLEGLIRTLDERVAQSRTSLLVKRPDLAEHQHFDPLLDRLLELGSIQSADTEGQILRFVIEDIVRRPGDRGVLVVAPGARWLPDVLETLHEIRGRATRTEIVVLAEGVERDTNPHVTWIAKSQLDARRSFLVYYGEGPAYAMIGSTSGANAGTPIFQTADRSLVEHLAFELQRELGILISV